MRDIYTHSQMFLQPKSDCGQWLSQTSKLPALICNFMSLFCVILVSELSFRKYRVDKRNCRRRMCCYRSVVVAVFQGAHTWDFFFFSFLQFAYHVEALPFSWREQCSSKSVRQSWASYNTWLCTHKPLFHCTN